MASRCNSSSSIFTLLFSSSSSTFLFSSHTSLYSCSVCSSLETCNYSLLKTSLHLRLTSTPLSIIAPVLSSPQHERTRLSISTSKFTLPSGRSEENGSQREKEVQLGYISIVAIQLFLSCPTYHHAYKSPVVSLAPRLSTCLSPPATCHISPRLEPILSLSLFPLG